MSLLWLHFVALMHMSESASKIMFWDKTAVFFFFFVFFSSGAYLVGTFSVPDTGLGNGAIVMTKSCWVFPWSRNLSMNIKISLVV